jgi:hypothetical protein
VTQAPGRLGKRPELLTLLGVSGAVLLSLALHLWQLDRTGLRGDEAVYAGQAAVLADAPGYSRHFLLVSRGSSNFLLHQELLSLVYRVVGVSDLAARLVSAVLSTATVGVVFLAGRTLYGRRAGLLAAMLLAVSAYALSLGRLALLDPMITLLFALALLMLALWDRGKQPVWLALFAASVSLAIQAKVVGVLLAGVFLGHLVITGSWRSLTRRAVLLAALLFVVCFAPALVQLLRSSDQLTTMLSSSILRRSHVPWYYYGRILLTYEGPLLPVVWVAGVLLALARRRRADVLPLLVVALGIAFFQLYPLKAFNYVLVLVPALCVLGGRALAELRVPRLAAPSAALPLTAALGLILVALPHLKAVLQDNTAAGLREASEWLSHNARPQDGVMTLSHGSAQYTFAFYGHHDAYPYGRFQLATVEPGGRVVKPAPDPLGGTPRDWVTTYPERLLQSGKVRYLAFYNNRLAGLTPQAEDQVSDEPIVETSTQRRFQQLIATYGGELRHTVRQGRDPVVWIYEVRRQRPRPIGSFSVAGELLRLEATGFQRQSDVAVRYRGKRVGSARTDESGSLHAAFPLPSGLGTQYRLIATDAGGNYLSLTGLPRPHGDFTMQGNRVLTVAHGFAPGAHITATYHGRRVGAGITDGQGKLRLSFPLPTGTRPRYRLEIADRVGNHVVLTQLPSPRVSATSDAAHIRAVGSGFAAGELVQLSYHGLPVGSARTDGKGRFSTSFRMPRSLQAAYLLRATDAAGYTATVGGLKAAGR